MLWRIGEVNSIFMETAGLRQDKNGQIDVIDIWMIKLFINPGRVDKNSSMMFTWWFEIIKLSLGTLCGCLGLYPVILSQILTSAAWGFDISGLRKQFSPRPWEVTKEIFFIAKFSLAEFPRNRLVQFSGEDTPKHTFDRVSILHLNFPQYQRDDCYCKLNIEERIIPASTLLGLL